VSGVIVLLALSGASHVSAQGNKARIVFKNETTGVVTHGDWIPEDQAINQELFESLPPDATESWVEKKRSRFLFFLPPKRIKLVGKKFRESPPSPPPPKAPDAPRHSPPSAVKKKFAKPGRFKH